MERQIQTFEDLKVWQLASEICNEIFGLVKNFPTTEKYSLTNQIIRSSRSISDNIAEGYGRYHHQENIQFCRIARGSSYELLNQLITAHDCMYISNEELELQKKQIINCVQLLNGYIRYLNKAKSNDSVNENAITFTGSVSDIDPNNQ